MKKILLVLLLVIVGVIVIVAAVSPNTQTATATVVPAAPAPTIVPAKAKISSSASAIAARKEYAKLIDEKLLDLGIESRTVAVGSDASTLIIHDVLAGRVREHALGQSSALFEQMKALGFKKLKYTDDGDMGWTWDLDK